VLVGSLIGCLSSSFASLLVSRILMGAVMPMLALPEAVAADTMPPERAAVVIGAIHAGTGTGIAGGLVLGGLAGAGEASWRWFFIVGTVASAAGIVATRAWLRDAPGRAEGRLDLASAAMLAAGLAAVLLAVIQGPSWGWGTPQVWGLALPGLAVLGACWRRQGRVAHPLVDTRRLVSEQARLPMLMTILAALGIYSALTALSRFALSDPSEVGYGYGWTPLKVAWYAVPQTVGCVIGFVLIRVFVRRDRVVRALALGFVVMIGAFLLFGLLTTHPAATLVALGLDSLGLATVLAITQVVMVRSVPHSESGVVLGLAVILYTLGNAIGTAVVAVLFDSFTTHGGAPSIGAFRLAYAFGAAAAAVALALYVPLARRLGARRPRSAVAGRQPIGRPASTP
jgi:MFS family permease